MKTSDQGIDLITQREGCKLEAYRDSVGVWTIGVGHTAGVVEGMTITQEEAMDLLREDLAWSEAAVNMISPLEQNQFDALVSFVFNVGQGAFASSTMRRMLVAGEPIEAVAAQFDRWSIPPEIISRRMGEKAQFLGVRFEARINGPVPNVAAGPAPTPDAVSQTDAVCTAAPGWDPAA